MITCYNLSYEYLPGKPILQDVSLRIQEGAFYFLTGASGAGKSSLLNVLSLATRPTSGRLMFFGEDVTQMNHDELPHLRRRVGTVFQDFQLLEHLTVAENIALPLKIAGEERSVIRARIAEILDWIGLSGTENTRPRFLSGGQKQRVAIARAVINNPPLLLADEPSGNLDPNLSKRLMYLFESLNKMGTTVVFATHDEHLVKAFRYPVLNLKNGRLTELPPINERTNQNA